MAKIVWQDAKPFNLFTHHFAKSPYNIPHRILNKLKRKFKSLLGVKFVQRNWELQFLGSENQKNINSHLKTDSFNKEVDKELVKKTMDLFYDNNSVYHSHALSMLLTMGVFLNSQK